MEFGLVAGAVLTILPMAVEVAFRKRLKKEINLRCDYDLC